MAALLETELPVCPVCLRVGKIPGQSVMKGRVSLSCNGGKEQLHKQAKMELRRFREVRSP